MRIELLILIINIQAQSMLLTSSLSHESSGSGVTYVFTLSENLLVIVFFLSTEPAFASRAICLSINKFNVVVVPRGGL